MGSILYIQSYWSAVVDVFNGQNEVQAHPFYGSTWSSIIFGAYFICDPL